MNNNIIIYLEISLPPFTGTTFISSPWTSLPQPSNFIFLKINTYLHFSFLWYVADITRRNIIRDLCGTVAWFHELRGGERERNPSKFQKTYTYNLLYRHNFMKICTHKIFKSMCPLLQKIFLDPLLVTIVYINIKI